LSQSARDWRTSNFADMTFGNTFDLTRSLNHQHNFMQPSRNDDDLLDVGLPPVEPRSRKPERQMSDIDRLLISTSVSPDRHSEEPKPERPEQSATPCQRQSRYRRTISTVEESQERSPTSSKWDRVKQKLSSSRRNC
jgi:hypothetical protein